MLVEELRARGARQELAAVPGSSWKPPGRNSMLPALRNNRLSGYGRKIWNSSAKRRQK